MADWPHYVFSFSNNSAHRVKRLVSHYFRLYVHTGLVGRPRGLEGCERYGENDLWMYVGTIRFR